MPHASTAPRCASPMRTLFQPYSFTCTCCERTEHCPQPLHPAGWAVEHVGGGTYLFCPDCAIDLPNDAQTNDAQQIGTPQ